MNLSLVHFSDIFLTVYNIRISLIILNFSGKPTRFHFDKFRNWRKSMQFRMLFTCLLYTTVLQQKCMGFHRIFQQSSSLMTHKRTHTGERLVH